MSVRYGLIGIMSRVRDCRYFVIKIGGMDMPKGESFQRSEDSTGKSPSANYDYTKTVVNLAKKNGWDLDSLGLVAKDLPREAQVSLTRKQVLERNRMVRDILKRFSRILTPPIPADLEKSLKKKGITNLLPWETEVLERAEKWRKQVKKAKPEILEELRRAILSPPE
jgi:hypothetical protein